MYCSNCGSKNDDAARFCTNCGANIALNSEDEADMTLGATPNAAPTVRPATYIAPAAHAAAVAAKQPNKTLLYLIIAGAAVLVVAVAIIVAILFNNNILGNNQADTNAGTDASVSGAQNVPGETVRIEITQIDTSMFPNVTLYFSALNEQGVPITDLSIDAFEIFETADGSDTAIVAKEFSTSAENVPFAVSLVLDNSGSMDGSALLEAKQSAKQFLQYVDFGRGDKVEVMEFNSDVYVRAPFGTAANLLATEIDSMPCEGGTALYDALYTALTRAYSQTGPKCILAFTDGEENESTYTESQVKELSKSTGIPIFLIGVGDQIDGVSLENLALETGGRYYYAPSAVDLESIYKDVYGQQQEQCVLSYESKRTSDLEDWHDLKLSYADSTYIGEAIKEFIPRPEDDMPIELLFSNVTASSIHEQEYNSEEDRTFTYLPYHAIDQQYDTPWFEAADGDGIGEWLKVDFTRPVSLSGMYIQNGYWRREDRLHENSRIKKMRVEFSDGSSEDFDLEDTVGKNFEALIRTDGQRIDFATQHTTSYIKITILEAYPGTRWDDNCISGIKLFR